MSGVKWKEDMEKKSNGGSLYIPEIPTPLTDWRGFCHFYHISTWGLGMRHQRKENKSTKTTTAKLQGIFPFSLQFLTSLSSSWSEDQRALPRGLSVLMVTAKFRFESHAGQGILEEKNM